MCIFMLINAFRVGDFGVLYGEVIVAFWIHSLEKQNLTQTTGQMVRFEILLMGLHQL